MEIIDNTPANYLVRRDDGTTDTLGKSKQNRLLIEHNLWGLLQDGTEVLSLDVADQPPITVVPSEEAREFTLSVGDYESIHLGPHKKSELVDALIEEEQEARAESLVTLFDRIRENRVRTEVIDAFLGQQPFADTVESNADGWLIHDHLLLTWECEFYHPNTTTYERSGSTVEQGSSEPAYEPDINPPESDERSVTLNGTDYRLTNAEMEFIARALWGVANAPRDL